MHDDYPNWTDNMDQYGYANKNKISIEDAAILINKKIRKSAVSEPQFPYIVGNTGEIKIGSKRTVGLNMYSTKSEPISYLNDSLESVTVNVLYHRCGEKIKGVPSRCPCGSYINKCACGKPTDLKDAKDKPICIDCAYAAKLNLCMSTGKICETKPVYYAADKNVHISVALKLNKCTGDCGKELFNKKTCHTCFEKLFYACPNCGISVERAKALDIDKKYCNKCGKIFIHGPKGFMPSTRKFGLELELNIGSINEDLWKIETDASVNGFEFKSPIYSGGTLFHDDINRFCSKVEKFNGKAGKDCGFHMHVEVKDFDHSDMINMYNNALKIQDWHFTILPTDRLDGRWSKPLKNITKAEFNEVKTLKQFFDLYKKKNPAENTNYLRYKWLNFLAHERFNTVEVRSHPGTYDPERIEKWVELWVAFVEFSKTRQEFKDPYTMMSEMGMRRSTILYFKKKHELMKG